jgi:hypothetical protein
MKINNTISFALDQFLHTDDLLNEIPGDVIGPTVSLCHHCHQHIPAYTYSINGQLWMVKKCRMHGVSHHMIERDYDFIKQLSHGSDWAPNDTVLMEVSDRCNVDCPHCYHIPDNTIPDKSIGHVLREIKTFYKPDLDICLTGAEASMRRDFPELISSILSEFPGVTVSTLTNGIRFADKDFLKQCVDAGLSRVRLGLNHSSYLDNKTIRKKQIQSIYNLQDLGQPMNYIGYTMASMSELEDILEETTSSDWHPFTYRIRYGSDIGRYPDQQRMYVSDIFKITQAWCKSKGKKFKIMDQADNNLYHVMVTIDNVPYRLIQWCDETDINMEELRTGPWCSFVPGGVTNFLHQVIRRDVWKNQQIPLTDNVPLRYRLNGHLSTAPLDFRSLNDPDKYIL